MAQAQFFQSSYLFRRPDDLADAGDFAIAQGGKGEQIIHVTWTFKVPDGIENDSQ